MEKVRLRIIRGAADLLTSAVQTTFKEGKGKVYMTRATKAIYNIVMRDFVKIR